MYMPQLQSDEDKYFWDIWFHPVDYTTAKNIKNQLLRTGVARNRIRIVWRHKN